MMFEVFFPAMHKSVLIFLLLFLPVIKSHALLVFGGDNNANTSAPDNPDVPWDATARIANYNEATQAVSAVAGTAVHLGHGFMLTAHHVIVRSHVSFDGVNWLAVDTSFTPVEVAAGVDLKVFKLIQVPTTMAVTLHGGGGEVGVLGYSVGWGRGREFDSQIGQNVQDFGKDGTIAKRWGTNVIKAAAEVTWDGLSGGSGYTQDALVSVLGNNEGPNEAALALWDSGSPFFQEINGSMVLTGIAGSRSMQNGGPGDFKATFGDDRLSGSPFGRGDLNLFVQIGPYSEDILAIIPEPSSYGFGLGFAVLALVLRRRRQETGDRSQ